MQVVFGLAACALFVPVLYHQAPPGGTTKSEEE